LDRAPPGHALPLPDEAAAAEPGASLWRQTPRGARWLGRVVAPVVVALVVLLALWQWYASAPGANALVLPTPITVWTTLIRQRAALWDNALVTLWETALGFSVALAAGAAFGVLIDASAWLRRALYPLLVMSQTIPLIALAPLLVLWFGPDLRSKVIVVVLVCFFPITVALADGLRAVDPELIKLFRAFGAGSVRIFWSVRLPGALPSLFSGIRIAIAYSIIGAIFAEYVGANAGLGLYMQLELHSFATAAVIAAVVVAAALSVALFALVAVVERLALPWYYAERRREGL
jgi:ABC-type nitrate/sulfonate/bicarbonate transport system permease component